MRINIIVLGTSITLSTHAPSHPSFSFPILLPEWAFPSPLAIYHCEHLKLALSHTLKQPVSHFLTSFGGSLFFSCSVVYTRLCGKYILLLLGLRVGERTQQLVEDGCYWMSQQGREERRWFLSWWICEQTGVLNQIQFPWDTGTALSSCSPNLLENSYSLG